MILAIEELFSYLYTKKDKHFEFQYIILIFTVLILRSEGDSNPRAAFGDYTLSRRASSTTRAPLQMCDLFAVTKVVCFFILTKAHC